MFTSKMFVSEVSLCRIFAKYLKKQIWRSSFNLKLRENLKNSYFPGLILGVFLPFGLSVSLLFLQRYWKVWISLGEQLSRTEISYLFFSYLWDLKIQILIIITCSKATKHAIVSFLSWSRPIFLLFSKLIFPNCWMRTFICRLNHIYWN